LAPSGPWRASPASATNALGDVDAVGVVDALRAGTARPVGMMFAAAVGGDARLLELAYEFEEARPWARIQG